MPQQHKNPEPSYVPNLSAEPKPEQTSKSARIDAYLDSVCLPMLQTLSIEEVRERRAEMRSHLDALIAANIELGASESLSVSLALEQFGKEQSVARAWKQECEQATEIKGNGTLWSALRPVLGYTALNSMVFPLLVIFYAHIINDHGHSGQHPLNLLMALALAVFIGEYTLFPAAMGYIVGRRSRGKVLAIAVLALPFLLGWVSGIFIWIYQQGFGLLLPPPGTHYHLTFVQEIAPCALYYCSISIGCVVAVWRRKRKRLRLAGSR